MAAGMAHISKRGFEGPGFRKDIAIQLFTDFNRVNLLRGTIYSTQ
jgi:hypothetical protein